MAFRTNKVPAIEERTVSGSSVSFNSAFALPLKACISNFEGYQEGSGIPSPSNIRLLHAYSQATLTENNTPHVLTFGRSVYIGSINWLTGEVMASWLLYNLGNLTWTYDIQYSRFVSNIIEEAKQSGARGLTFYCECYRNINDRRLLSNVPDLSIYNGSEKALYIHDSTFGNDVNSLIAFITDKYVALPLAEPIIIQLSPTELSSIIGNNTFSTDTGTLEITFSDLQEKSASGAVASFNTALAMPLVECKTEFMCTQEAGTPSPSNPLAITGVDEIRLIKGQSVNLLPFYNDIDFTKNRIHYYTQNGNLYLDGTSTSETSSSDVVFRQNFDFYLNKGTYTMSRQYGLMYVYKFVGDTVAQIASASSPTFTLTERTHCFIGFYVYQATYDNLMQGGQINVGSSALPYEPCKPYTDVVIDLDGTRYGGYVDVVGKKGYGTWNYLYINDASDAEIFAYNNMNGIRFPNRCPRSNRQSGISNMSNKVGRDFSSGALWCGVLTNDSSLYWVGILDILNMTLDQFKLWIVDHPLEVAYQIQLETDYTVIDLDIPTLSTIIGNNSFASDSGSIELKYKDLDIAKRGNFREVFKLPS